MLWSRTGWRPDDVASLYPQPKSDLAQFEKYNPGLSSRVHGAIIAQYAVLSIIHLWSAGQAEQLPLSLLWITVVAQAYILVVVGAILDGKHYVRLLEYSRLLALTAMLYAGFAADLISITGLYYAVAYLLISAGLTWVCVKPASAAEVMASSDAI